MAPARQTFKIKFSKNDGNDSSHPWEMYSSNISPYSSDFVSQQPCIPPRQKQLADIIKLTGQEGASGLDNFSAFMVNILPINASNRVAYVISFSWWKNWVTYCFASNDDLDRNPNLFPGKIHNDHLVESEISSPRSSRVSYTTKHYILKPNLLYKKDYIVVNVHIWNALENWYSGEPMLPRLILRNQYDSTANTDPAQMVVGRDIYSTLLNAPTPDIPFNSNAITAATAVIADGIVVDLYPAAPINLDDEILLDQAVAEQTTDQNNSTSSSFSSSSSAVHSTATMASTTPRTIIRVKSFHLNDCGASITHTASVVEVTSPSPYLATVSDTHVDDANGDDTEGADDAVADSSADDNDDDLVSVAIHPTSTTANAHHRKSPVPALPSLPSTQTHHLPAAGAVGVQTGSSSSSSSSSAAGQVPVVLAATAAGSVQVSATTSSGGSVGTTAPTATVAPLSARYAEMDRVNTCFVCRAVSAQRCSRCTAVYYCMSGCQKVCNSLL